MVWFSLLSGKIINFIIEIALNIWDIEITQVIVLIIISVVHVFYH